MFGIKTKLNLKAKFKIPTADLKPPGGKINLKAGGKVNMTKMGKIGKVPKIAKIPKIPKIMGKIQKVKIQSPARISKIRTPKIKY